MGKTIVGGHVLALIGLLAMAGCSAGHDRQPFVQALTLDLEHSPAVRVTGVHVHPDDGRAMLHGRVRHRAWGASVLAGHVDVEVRTPDGRTMRQASVTLDVASHPMNKSLDATFQVELPAPVPAGSVLRVQYHAAEHT